MFPGLNLAAPKNTQGKIKLFSVAGKQEVAQICVYTNEEFLTITRKDMTETWDEETGQCKIKLEVKTKTNSENVICNGDTSVAVIDDVCENLKENCQVRDASYISLASNALKCVSINFIESVNNIVELDLSDNKLNDLPSSLSALSNLQYLNISYNKFSIVPTVVTELKRLKSLIAKNNSLEKISNEIGDLLNLTNLDLSYNKLTEIPSSCSELNRLQNLSLAGNKFPKIPSCVFNGMKMLKTFDFSENHKAKLNIAPYSVNLRAFYAKNNGTCPLFPSWVLSSKYYELKTVVLDDTKFSKIELPNPPLKSRLKKISIRNGNLWGEAANNIVSRITHLECIDFGNDEPLTKGNCFWSLPIPESRHVSSIKEIHVTSTGIPFLPKTIGDFTSLSVIDISGNNIFWLPNEICQLKSLKHLIMSGNDLLHLPDDIGNMEALEVIGASFNKLSAIPESIKNLNNLQYLDLYDNELIAFPEGLVELNLVGMDLERNYFSASESMVTRNIHYESMVTHLREHLPNGYKGVDGPKELIVPPSDVDEDSERTSYSDGEEANCNFFRIDNSSPANSVDDERWDISEDSADEFDPHEYREPRDRCVSPLAYYDCKRNLFCPGDNHERGVKSRVIEMLQNGTIVWPTVFAEGQFDDP